MHHCGHGTTPETKKAIAVVNLDEHTYYSRPFSVSKRRKKTVTKIWAGNRDRPAAKIIPFPDRFSTHNGNFLVHNLNSVATKQTTAEMGYRLKVIPI